MNRLIGAEARKMTRRLKAMVVGLLAGMAVAAGAQNQPSLTLDPSALMDWAERTYPDLFPSHQQTQPYGPYLFRYYAQTQAYLGVDGQFVQYVGPASSFQILTVGRLSDFACRVEARFCAAGPFDKRSWEAPIKLVAGTQPVKSVRYGIDDDGRVIAVFLQSDGKRNVLWGTRITPGSGSTPSSFTTPQPVDLQGGVPRTLVDDYSVTVAPNGDALVVWRANDPCDASTYKTSGTCTYLFSARYSAADGGWSAPARGPDTPDDAWQVRFNSQGDVVMQLTGWLRKSTNSYTAYKALAWLPHGQAVFQQRIFSEVSLGDRGLAMDAAGNFALAAEVAQNATTDVVIYRGTPAGVAPQQILDVRGSAAALHDVAMGQGGQTVVYWTQNNGTKPARYAAVAASAQEPMVVSELPVFVSGTPTAYPVAVVTDDGVVIDYEFQTHTAQYWRSGVWSSMQAFPSNVDRESGYANAFTRRGDILTVLTNGGFCHGGAWGSFDANTGKQPKSVASKVPADFVLGLDTCIKSVGAQAPVVSLRGIGAQLFINGYDVMPSATLPNGDKRNVHNLWVSVFR